MKKNISDYLVALAVIACSAVLLAALAFALGSGGKKSSRTLDIDFPDVTGIRVRSELRYAGAPVGSVSKIRLLTNDERNALAGAARENAVRVSVELLEGTPELPGDVRATLSSDTLLSEKFIALSAGTPDAPKLANGVILQGQGGGLTDVLNSLGPVFKNVDQALSSIEPLVRKTTSTLDSLKTGIETVLPKVSKVAESAQTAVVSADGMIKRADKLIADNEGGVKTDLTELKNALTKVQDALKNVDGFVGNTDKQLAARMKELSVVLQNLKVVTTQAKAFTQTIGERPNKLIFGGKAQNLTPESEILHSDKPLPATRP